MMLFYMQVCGDLRTTSPWVLNLPELKELMCNYSARKRKYYSHFFGGRIEAGLTPVKARSPFYTEQPPHRQPHSQRLQQSSPFFLLYRSHQSTNLSTTLHLTTMHATLKSH
jgi:hypothetical protein